MGNAGFGTMSGTDDSKAASQADLYATVITDPDIKVFAALNRVILTVIGLNNGYAVASLFLSNFPVLCVEQFELQWVCVDVMV